MNKITTHMLCVMCGVNLYVSAEDWGLMWENCIKGRPPSATDMKKTSQTISETRPASALTWLDQDLGMDDSVGLTSNRFSPQINPINPKVLQFEIR